MERQVFGRPHTAISGPVTLRAFGSFEHRPIVWFTNRIVALSKSTTQKGRARPKLMWASAPAPKLNVRQLHRACRGKKTVLDADPLTGPRLRNSLDGSSPDKARHRTSHPRRSITMPHKLCYLTPLFAAVASAVIATAPTAAADAVPTQPTAVATAPAAVDPTQSICTSLGGWKTRCQTPGNVQINDSPPPLR